VPNGNGVHRQECCEACRFFVEQDTAAGACHRYPPRFGGETPREMHRWRFPVVGRRGWCGEFVPAAGGSA
jgi:hypothetical protein